MTEIQLNMYHALALGAAMYALGLVLTKKIPVFSRFCIPAPLVGGLCFAIFNTILYATGTAVITFDDTLQTVFMIFFFTTVGFTVSIPMLLKSGKSVIMLLILSIVMIILQNVVGSGVMALMGKDPLYGLACGSIAMIGGPARRRVLVLTLTRPVPSAARRSPSRRRRSASSSVRSSAARSPASSSSRTTCATSLQSRRWKRMSTTRITTPTPITLSTVSCC